MFCGFVHFELKYIVGDQVDDVLVMKLSLTKLSENYKVSKCFGCCICHCLVITSFCVGGEDSCWLDANGIKCGNGTCKEYAQTEFCICPDGFVMNYDLKACISKLWQLCAVETTRFDHHTNFLVVILGHIRFLSSHTRIVLGKKKNTEFPSVLIRFLF